MDIKMRHTLDTRLLDIVARGVLGAATIGVSAGDRMARIHLASANPPEQQRASDLLHNFGALSLGPGVAPQIAGASAVFSVSGGRLAADEQVAYAILSAAETALAGQAALADGAISLDLSELAAGDYTLVVYRIRDNCASGSVAFSLGAA